MDSAPYRHRRSPLSSRFLGECSLSQPPSAAAAVELTEADVCFSADFSELTLPHRYSGGADAAADRRRLPPLQLWNAGILSALPSFASSRGIVVPGMSRNILPALPRPVTAEREREYSQSVPSEGKFHQSEPVRIPLACTRQRRENSGVFGAEDSWDDGDYNGEEDEMLPPHEMVARGSQRITCSVLEGAGRTLKGRDLRQVRNAIWRQTGFLD